MSFADHFSRQSLQYTQFRPRYPRELFAYLASLTARYDMAWDCGTGNGQAAAGVAQYFANVVATDPSTNQITHAQPHLRVEYVVAAAERCPLPDESVDLITVAQAVHWFDREAFYAEVRRIARDDTVLAVWGYGLATINPEIDRLVGALYEPILGEYWPPECRLIEQRYTTIEFPFEEVEFPELAIQSEWTLAQLLGYLGTWSSVQAYRQRHATDPLTLVEERLAAAWGDAGTARSVRWPLFGRIGYVA